ncbi:hypothetical protein [Paraburkholderia atlantica]|uniref:hypothetical protein n=1 Tax=Paraburkholderia atlantica TaxID=2654982 RepID=UPI0016156022|nr:hypothetical protein [Paraburkholderia atlantica]MBB5420605.1 hypothetical protein [Paraburkholderia atlantica]
MSRRKPELQVIDVAAWPTVAYTELDEPARRKFEARQQAILRYIGGEPVRAIEESTHFNRRQLYRWLERAQMTHPDGRPFGFRALIHYVRIAEYGRIHDVQLQGERGSRGAAGALAQLLERYPTLTGWLLLQVKQRKVLLEQVHTEGHLRTRLRGLQSLRDNFLRQCRSVGLTAADYPLNTADHAIRSLSRPRTFTIPGLAYGPHDGFPSGHMPELAYVTWEWIRLDNAKANVANETMTALCEFVGCLADAGPKHSPDERPYIERFFGTIASRLSSRLPGYTGSHIRDLRRALSDPKGDLRLYVSLDELAELVEYAISGYNGTPHRGLNNATPLEAMEYFVRGRDTMLVWLSEHQRRTLCLMQSARQCRVRAYLQQGVRPHINLFGVRYTNRVLATSTQLIGQHLLIYMNADDLRSVRAFLADGTELGVLKAQGAWRVVPHNLKLRQHILRQTGKRRRPTSPDLNLIEAYIDEKRTQAKKSRKAATELAHATWLLASAPTVHTPLGPPRPPWTDPVTPGAAPAMDAQAATIVELTPRTSVRPRKLSIGTGQVF